MSDILHYYFGYGSLVNRATRPADEPYIPVRLQGWHRSWSHRVQPHKHGRSCCSLGVFQHRDQPSLEVTAASIDGVLVPIRAAELPQLDERESGYNRVVLSRAQLQGLSGASLDIPDQAQLFLYQSDVEHDGPASEQFPILQSYVDCVMAGYLSCFGERGLTDLLDSTTGWTGCRLDDRAAPIYVRAQRIEARLLARFDSLLEPYSTPT